MIGLKPRSLSWIIPHRLAIAERPGGSGTTHRRIRREEEVCWLVKNDFGAIVSLLPSTHNITAYTDAGLEAVQIPVTQTTAVDCLAEIFATLDRFVRDEQKKTFLHSDDIDDVLVGICGAYLLHLGAVANAPSAVATIEAVTSRPLDTIGRAIVQAVAPE